MGPQRKQQMLDDARKASPEVATAYDALKLQLQQDGELRKELVNIPKASGIWHRGVSMASSKLQGELHSALSAYGMNKFNSRDLAAFAARGDDDISRG